MQINRADGTDMRNIKRGVLSALLAVLIGAAGGCGQSGPLYLPPAESAAEFRK